MAAIGVHRLWDAEALVEVQGVAAVNLVIVFFTYARAGSSSRERRSKNKSAARMPIQSAGQELLGQAGVEVGQPPPAGQHADVVGEGRTVVGAARQRRSDRGVLVEELLYSSFELVQVPPVGGPSRPGRRTRDGRRGTGRRTRPVRAGAAGRRSRRAGAPARSRRRSAAVPKPSRASCGAQEVPLVPLGLGHREHREHPAVGRRSPARAGRSGRRPRAGSPGPRRTVRTRPRRRGAPLRGCRAA